MTATPIAQGVAASSLRNRGISATWESRSPRRAGSLRSTTGRSRPSSRPRRLPHSSWGWSHCHWASCLSAHLERVAGALHRGSCDTRSPAGRPAVVHRGSSKSGEPNHVSDAGFAVGAVLLTGVVGFPFYGTFAPTFRNHRQLRFQLVPSTLSTRCTVS
ncbi:phosphoethanolamine transferase domain-containing protein [Variovorax sp. JS1663]|uniref:phosphoethanolamine transferase domain-containing protein n=1 Tax=Variovorax sp. JS1663 TaxID=1851577 RepID=UPI003FD5D785